MSTAVLAASSLFSLAAKVAAAVAVIADAVATDLSRRPGRDSSGVRRGTGTERERERHREGEREERQRESYLEDRVGDHVGSVRPAARLQSGALHPLVLRPHQASCKDIFPVS